MKIFYDMVLRVRNAFVIEVKNRERERVGEGEREGRRG